MNKAWELVKAELLAWNGYCEKKTDDVKYIADKTANAGYNEYNYFAHWFDTQLPGWLNKVANKSWIGWCTAYVPYGVCKVFGGDAAARFFNLPGTGEKNLILSVGMTANYFADRDEYYARAGFDPQEGDIIFIDPKGAGAKAHIGWVIGRAANGKVITIEGNTSRTADLPYCGGCVAQKQYWTYDKRVTGYARPTKGWAYLNALLEEKPEVPVEPEPVELDETQEEIQRTLHYGCRGKDVKALQAALKVLGYDTAADGEGVYGWQTVWAVGEFELDRNKEIDGVADAALVEELGKAVAGEVSG